MKNLNVIERELVNGVKELTINEISQLTNIPSPTIRAWSRTPINGQIWSSESINMDKVMEMLSKRFEDDDFEKLFGCSISQIQIVKTERMTNDYIAVEELVVDDKYRIHNYSFTKDVVFKGITQLGDTKLWIFQNEKGYHTYDEEMIGKTNIKIERL